ncbi:MAG: Flp family type IVb pilin [Acidobacteria bacterium]|nr:Flp family type IVb pilin [Acidobacteriota bacterium]
MKKIRETLWRVRLWRDLRGQDLVEYALLAGFVAVVAGVTIPNVSASMSTIYSLLASKLIQAGG